MEYKLNKYQTALTPELLDSLPKEVRGDLIETLESIKFVQWLVSSEEVRGYARNKKRWDNPNIIDDRKEDPKGRIYVDITSPHILENTDFFRERAIFFKKNGKYTDIPVNPNPKSAYAEFWKEEQRRWKYGLVRPSDGEWITGYHYFYLNYVHMWINEEDDTNTVGVKRRKVRGTRKREFPDFWLGDYLWFHYMEQARDTGQHCKLLKKRGSGFSWKFGGITPCTMYTQPGLPNFHLASDKGYLEGDKGVFGKVVDVLDWIAGNTPLPKLRLTDKPLEKVIGYKDTIGTRKGLLSSVFGISLKDDPDKARGLRGPIIHYEEDGVFDNLEDAWNVNLEATEDGGIVFGTQIAGGCVCEGTKVWTKEGKLVNIEDITSNTGILGYNGEYASIENVTYIQQETYKDCVEIITEGGGMIRCSTDHPLLMTEKKDRVHRICGKKFKGLFKKAEDLQIGDRLLLSNNVNIFGNKKLEHAYLIGMLIGDGSYGVNCKYPTLSVTTEEVYEWLNSNYDIDISKLRNTTTGLYAQVYFKNLKPYLETLGLLGQAKELKTLPLNIEQYDKESICELLGGYFEADGNIQIKGNSRSIKLTCKYKEMLENVQYLLLKIGIVSSIIKEKKGGSELVSIVNSKTYQMKRYDCHVLYITHQEYVEVFKNNIHFKSKYKQERLDSSFKNNVGTGVLKDDVTFKLSDNGKGKYFIDNPNLKNLHSLPIKSITFIGKQRVYNLTANTTHTYLTNRFISANTGGTKNANFAGSEKLFYNPEAYSVYGIPNLFDKNTSGNTKCGFFWGAYLNRSRCTDKTCGEPDVIKALIEVLTDRYIIKSTSPDTTALTQRKAEQPITPQDAVMRIEGSIFPTADLKEYLADISPNLANFVSSHYVGDIVYNASGELVFKFNDSKSPIRDYPIENSLNKEGAIEIFELPQRDGTGNIATLRYISSCDPIDDDSSTTNSLPSIFIFDRFTDRIVAEYTGRPRTAVEFYDVCIRMLEFYNATMNYENDKKGLFAHFSNKNKLHLLCDTPQILKDKQLIKDTALYGNKAKGVNSSKAVNAWGRRLQADWLMEPAYGEKESGKLNMHKIRSIAYLKELIAWTPDLNCDRVSSMGMLMIYREDLAKFEVRQFSKKVKTKLDDGFFRRQEKYNAFGYTTN